MIVGYGALLASFVELARATRGCRSASCRTSRARSCSDSLSSADVHFVGLARGLAGYVVPSRLLRDPLGRAAR